MQWQDDYKKKVVSAHEAVTHIQSHNRVVLGHATGEPQTLIAAMVDNAAAYERVEIIHKVAMGPSVYCQKEYAKNFYHNSFFVGASAREAVNGGWADYTPMFFHEMPSFLRDRYRPDVTMLSVSPPDIHGYCSLGVSVDYTKAATESSKIVIAEINKKMPRTHGDCYIHISDIDYIVESNVDLINLFPPNLTDVERAIGANVAALVNDGDCLQLGIGAIPDAVLASLTNLNDLGMHTEMFSDGAVDLIEAGNINNRAKNFNHGKSVATFLMGSRKLYDYVDDNPSVMMMPVDYVNDPRTACQNDNLVAINSCIQIDLMGQVVSDSVGLRQISGVGGQVDFVRAATMSKGGRAIIAMPSTSRGTISKIVPFINEGATVMTSRFDVDYVATEIGLTRLKGKTLRQRAVSLIEIAHPDFRDGLKEEFERRFHESYPANAAQISAER